MKKIVAIIMCLLLVLGLVACGTEPVVDQGTGTVNTETSKTVKFDNCSVFIDSCKIVKDYENNSIAIISFTFTNEDEEAHNFYTTVLPKAFQNGVEAEYNLMPMDNEYNSLVNDNYGKDIQKGASIVVECGFNLNDETSDLIIEVSDWLGLSDKKITKTFNLT